MADKLNGIPIETLVVQAGNNYIRVEPDFSNDTFKIYVENVADANHRHDNATILQDGFLSKEDKAKLDAAVIKSNTYYLQDSITLDDLLISDNELVDIDNLNTITKFIDSKEGTVISNKDIVYKSLIFEFSEELINILDFDSKSAVDVDITLCSLPVEVSDVRIVYSNDKIVVYLLLTQAQLDILNIHKKNNIGSVYNSLLNIKMKLY